jgi:hypothetical protein
VVRLDEVINGTFLQRTFYASSSSLCYFEYVDEHKMRRVLSELRVILIIYICVILMRMFLWVEIEVNFFF